MTKLLLQDLDVRAKKILMRVDFNVPLDSQGGITDETRILASLPSIQYVLEKGGCLILMSHLGRPKDQRTPALSLLPCAKRLSQLLGRQVVMAPDCIGPEVKKMASSLKPGQILMLENLRFHRGEEHPKEDPDFVRQLAELGDAYVNDAFGSAHRAHASTAAITSFFPKKAAAGFLLEKEMRFLGDALLQPKRPFYAIVGGAKISTKCGLLRVLLQKADALLIGGGMTYTFLKARGIAIGDSIHEDPFLGQARELMEASGKGCGRLLLPRDIVVSSHIQAGAPFKVIEAQQGIPSGFQGVDIGPETILEYSEELRHAQTILWNGPLGVFEIPQFAKGTNAIAHVLAQLKATTIVGGGDSIAALQAAGVADKITHISTGGGASLEYIEQGTLPGLEALSDQ